jgi:hypothetical protein
MVRKFLSSQASYPWERFEQDYFQVLESRFREDRTPFDKLAELASHQDVYIGCSCPTEKNPDVYHCHTLLALRFMQQHYPGLKVLFPAPHLTPPSGA